MPSNRAPETLERRSFVSRLGAGLAAFSGAFVGLSSHAGAQSPAQDGRWQPARHAIDNWLEEIPGQHRIFFDATSTGGAGFAITFASNYYIGSRNGYELQPAGVAVVLCYRHLATPFAYSDAVWAKYGAVFSARIQFVDPKTNAAPVINVYESREYGMTLPNRGTTLSSLMQGGAHIAVCDLATRAYAGLAATQMGLRQDDVYREFVASAVKNSHFVPAGVVALNHAQERGYSIAHVG